MTLLRPMPHKPADATAFTIREARPEDIEQVIELDEATTGVRKASYWDDMLGTSEIPANQQFFLVAMTDGGLLGFIIGEARAWEFGSPPCGWIFAIGVDPRTRLDGIGTALFEAVCERFRRAGMTKIRTMLARDAQLLMSFFRSQGMMAGPFIELEKDLDE